MASPKKSALFRLRWLLLAPIPLLWCVIAHFGMLEFVENRVLDLDLPAEEIERRFAEWTPPAPRYTSGVFAKYAAHVSSASEGAVTT